MPAIHARPCWSRFLEFDTSIAGATWMILAMAMIDLIDVTRNPKLLADLEMRCRAALTGLRAGNLGVLPGRNVPPLLYTEEPIDSWAAYSVLAERAPEQTICADCDCLGPCWCAFWKTRKGPGAPLRVGVAISQPNTRKCCTGPGCGDNANRLCGHGMAHMFSVLDMGPDFEPGSDFGGSLVKSETQCAWLREHGDPSPDTVWVWDASVAAGMGGGKGTGQGRPKPTFYGSGETMVLWMPEA